MYIRKQQLLLLFYNAKTKIMQKSVLRDRPYRPKALLRALLVLKFVVLIMLVATLQVNAVPLSGQNINLTVKQTEIKKILKMIENEGDYRFMFNSNLKDLKKKVDFSANNLSIEESLNVLFNGVDLTYRSLAHHVILVLEAENAKIKVSGRVTGPNGPVAGASVVERGTKNGTSTDANGYYTITVEDNSTLVFSSIGYATEQIAVANRTTIDVTLTPVITRGDEVVVIGYGTANRRDLTGSISKVGGDVVARQPNTNALSSLQSKVAGLQVVNNGDPGSTPDIRIRGTSSIGTTNPLYIVDGIFADNIDFVNPDDIESIEVLKDASSLAIFGFKGAGGAIIVTTKKGKVSGLSVNLNSTIGAKKLVDKIQLANGDQFRQLLNMEANNQVAEDPTLLSLYNFANNVGVPGMSAYTGNTDWIDAVTRTALFSTSNLSVDAGGDKNRLHFGVGYAYDEGLVKHTRYDRININFNDELKISNHLKTSVGVIIQRERLPYNSGALDQARRALPIMSADTKSYYMKNPYGVDSGYYNLYSSTPIIQNSETNPMATLENNWNKKIDVRNRVIGNFSVEWTPIRELSLKAALYGDMSFRDNREYTPLYNLYDPTLPEGDQVVLRNRKTAVSQYTDQVSNFQQDYTATFKKKFGDHSLSVMGGFTTYYHKYESLTANISQKEEGRNIIPNDSRFWYINSGFGDLSTANSNSDQNEYATVSYLARVLYNFKSKYYVNLSYRKDFASQINDDYKKKGQSFWAAGIAWEVSKEDFMANQHIFNTLKIKASTGELGNFNPAGLAYPAYPSVSQVSSAVFGNTIVPVNSPNYGWDPNLHWETVQTTEAGFEADFLNHRLHVDAVYYIRNTKDLLVLIPGISGALAQLRNFGSIRNQGLELSAEYTQELKKGMLLTVGGNFTTYKNKVTQLSYILGGSSSSIQSPSRVEVGMPIGYFYGLVVEGVYQSYADVLNSPVSTINGGGAKPGDLKYKDLNGDGVITDADRTMIGNPTPDFTYGITASLKYKGFDLGLDLAGVYGNEIYRVWGTSEQKNSVYNYPAYYTEGWTGPGTSNFVPVVNAAHLINRAPSTYGIEDGSYFRIRNLSLGYTFGVKMPGLIVKSIRAAVGVQNLKTWKHNKGYSPEYGGSAVEFGVDYGTSSGALPRITTFSLNINF